MIGFVSNIIVYVLRLHSINLSFFKYLIKNINYDFIKKVTKVKIIIYRFTDCRVKLGSNLQTALTLKKQNIACMIVQEGFSFTKKSDAMILATSTYLPLMALLDRIFTVISSPQDNSKPPIFSTNQSSGVPAWKEKILEIDFKFKIKINILQPSYGKKRRKSEVWQP